MAQAEKHFITRRRLIAGSAAMLPATAFSTPALSLETDPALGALGQEFERAMIRFEAAHQHYGACERRYFALRRGRSEAEVARLRREIVEVAEAAADASVQVLNDLLLRMYAAQTRSLAGAAIKARAVKSFGQPELWDDDNPEHNVGDLLAAQVLDWVMETARTAA